MKPAERLAAILYPARRTRPPGPMRQAGFVPARRRAEGGTPSTQARLTKLTRMLRGAPEAHLRILSTGGLIAAERNIAYITREDDPNAADKLLVEDEHGRQWTCGQAIDRVRSWVDVAPARCDWAGDRFAHVVLNAPPGADPYATRWAAREFAARTWAGHRYYLALHTDKRHPHVHVCLHRLREDGRVWQSHKPDLAEYRERWAQCLVAEGIEAVATSKTVRFATRPDVREHLRAIGQALERSDDVEVRSVGQAAQSLADSGGVRPRRMGYLRAKQAVRQAEEQAEHSA